jgi:hypothetical protein
MEEPPPDEPTSDREHYATFVVELLLAEDGRVRRTRVVHVQTGAEDRWPNWNGPRLLDFVVAHTIAPDPG